MQHYITVLHAACGSPQVAKLDSRLHENAPPASTASLPTPQVGACSARLNSAPHAQPKIARNAYGSAATFENCGFLSINWLHLSHLAA